VQDLLNHIRAGQTMREIVLDTETTGLNPFDGHRIVEIGAVELWHQVPTGRTYHQYINPERDMPEEAFNVHGISDAFLTDKPVFRAVAQAFMDFVEDSQAGDPQCVLRHAVPERGA
jgi:DNA polymerase-3 subunit epsilon